MFAAVALALAVALAQSPGADAQNPEKFERVVPAKPPPDRDNLARDIVRKAHAKEGEQGVCSRVSGSPVYSQSTVIGEANVGSPRLYKTRDGDCGVVIVRETTTKDGMNCKIAQIFQCNVRLGCGLLPYGRACQVAPKIWMYR